MKQALGKLRVVLFAGYLFLSPRAARKLFPAWEMPSPTGPYAIGARDLELTDPNRRETFENDSSARRRVMVTVWYPVERPGADLATPMKYPKVVTEVLALVTGLPTFLFKRTHEVATHIVEGAPFNKGDGPYPLVLFSPGILSTRFQSLIPIEDLVSHGFVVVGVDHPYSSGIVEFPDGATIVHYSDITGHALDRPARYKQNTVNIEIRGEDIAFVLDEIEGLARPGSGSWLEGGVDLESVGVLGHSFGGSTALQALTVDNRVSAGLSLEGGLWSDAIEHGISKPFTYLASEDSAEAFRRSDSSYLYYSPEWLLDQKSIVEHSSHLPAFEIVANFGHQSFSDIPILTTLISEGRDAIHGSELIRDYVKAFFQVHLLGQSTALLDGIHRKYPEIVPVANPADPYA